MAVATCTITGKLYTATGRPLEHAIVKWKIDPPPATAMDGTTRVGVEWTQGEAETDKLGAFSFVAVQGLHLRVVIEAVQYNKIVTVPSLTTKNLFDL